MSSKARQLRELFALGELIRIVGAHNGLGSKLIERNGFEGVWASGLEISTAHGVPDANILTMTENLHVAQTINEATTLPVVCDCDTGYGNAFNVIHMVKKYEAAGLAAAVIEDKRFPKVNSFVPGRQELEPIEEFSAKLEAAKAAQQGPDFMVFARVEALIAGWGMEEALKRARAYEKAGADGIVIHSKNNTPDEIFTFAAKWDGKIPLVCIPTTYYDVPAEEFARRGFRMVIYANQGLRAAMRAMNDTFRSIRETGSTAAVEGKISSMKEVFEIQGMTRMKSEEEKLVKKDALQAVIPAAGDHRFQPDFKSLLNDKPLCMLEVSGSTLIDRQTDLLRSCGVTEIFVVGGHQHDKIKADAKLLINAAYAKTRSAHSVMLASEHLKEKFLAVYADILFDRQILLRLLDSPHPVTLVIDRAYQTLPSRDKELDLVEIERSSGNGPRKLDAHPFKKILRVGKHIDKKKATDEFIGMCFFREQGLDALKKAWHDAQTQFKDKPFYEAPNAAQAGFTDLLQYLIDRGVEVNGMEIEHGWSEIHSLDDLERVNAYFQNSGKAGVAAR